MERKNGSHTLGRALDILFALSEANGTLTVSEIAEKVSIPESSTYRFLQTLEKNGFVERKGKNQVGLGLRILDLARSLQNQIHRDLLLLALPIMIELTERTRETSVLFVRAGHEIVCVQHVQTRELIQFSIENGRRLPLHIGASGKCILAFEQETIIQRLADSISGGGDQDKLLKSLSEIKEQGYSYTRGEFDPDVFAIGAPVMDSHGMAVASLSIAGPMYRCTDSAKPALIGSVVDAAKQLSACLGSG